MGKADAEIEAEDASHRLLPPCRTKRNPLMAMLDKILKLAHIGGVLVNSPVAEGEIVTKP